MKNLIIRLLIICATGTTFLHSDFKHLNDLEDGLLKTKCLETASNWPHFLKANIEKECINLDELLEEINQNGEPTSWGVLDSLRGLAIAEGPRKPIRIILDQVPDTTKKEELEKYLTLKIKISKNYKARKEVEKQRADAKAKEYKF